MGEDEALPFLSEEVYCGIVEGRGQDVDVPARMEYVPEAEFRGSLRQPVESGVFYIIEYAKDGLSPTGIPFIIVFVSKVGDTDTVRSLLISEWRSHLGPMHYTAQRHISDFLSDLRQVNHVTADARTALLQVVDSLGAGWLRTALDGLFDTEVFTLATPEEVWCDDQVACSQTTFTAILRHLKEQSGRP